MSKIGLFGGTFDPMHKGHTKLCEFVLKKMELDKIIFIPAGDPPHKLDKKVTDKSDRLNMVRLATEYNKSFCVSDYEIKKEARSYSYDLINHFKSVYKDDELYFIIGGDSLYNLPTWYRYEELLGLCTFVVISRPDVEKENLFDKFKGNEKPPRLFFIDDVKIPISSTEIREKVKNSEDIKDYVSEPVFNYITTKELYSVPGLELSMPDI